MAKLIFSIASIADEHEIFKMVRDKLEFIKSHRIRFTWPQTTIEEEYDEQKYQQYMAKVQSDWEKTSPDFIERLKVMFNIPDNRNYTVRISNYGPLGFYNTHTKTITVNMNTHLNVIDTIRHELVHLQLEPYVLKFNLTHEQKEELIETILNILNSHLA